MCSRLIANDSDSANITIIMHSGPEAIFLTYKTKEVTDKKTRAADFND